MPEDVCLNLVGNLTVVGFYFLFMKQINVYDVQL